MAKKIERPHPTRWVQEIEVTDPDTQAEVAVAIVKDMVTGAMVGVDYSYVDHHEGPVHDPYNKGQTLDIPEDDIDPGQPGGLKKGDDVYVDPRPVEDIKP